MSCGRPARSLVAAPPARRLASKRPLGASPAQRGRLAPTASAEPLASPATALAACPSALAPLPRLASCPTIRIPYYLWLPTLLGPVCKGRNRWRGTSWVPVGVAPGSRSMFGCPTGEVGRRSRLRRTHVNACKGAKGVHRRVVGGP